MIVEDTLEEWRSLCDFHDDELIRGISLKMLDEIERLYAAMDETFEHHFPNGDEEGRHAQGVIDCTRFLRQYQPPTKEKA